MTNWIKCSERLPEDFGISHLVFGLLEGDCRPDKHEAFLDSKKKWTSVRSTTDGFGNLRWVRITNVTHWQPLPEAPNEN